MLSRLRPSDRDRSHAVEALKLGYVEGRLSTDTFEARVAMAYAAPSVGTLRALLRDVRARLPGLGEERAVPGDAPAVATTVELVLPRGRTSPLVVGRSSACDVRLDSDAVSRRHAAIERVGAVWLVTDLASTNGTFVDDARTTCAPLRAGTRLQLADTLVRLA